MAVRYVDVQRYMLLRSGRWSTYSNEVVHSNKVDTLVSKHSLIEQPAFQ